MAGSTEDKQVGDDLERESGHQPIPAEPQQPSEPEPAGDPGTVSPDNGGWGTQGTPVAVS